MRNKSIIFSLLLVMFLVSNLVSASSIVVNNQKVNFDITPAEITDNTYIPLRELENKLGLEVNELSAEEYLLLWKGQFYILRVNSTLIKSSKGNLRVINPPLEVNGRILVPVSLLRDELNMKIRIKDKSKDLKPIDKEDITVDFHLNKEIIEGENKVTAIIELINKGKKDAVLNFSSGKKYDIVIKNKRGEVVYSWSEGKMFTQAFQKVKIEAGEKICYKERLNLTNLPSGVYFIQAKVESIDYNLLTDSRIIYVRGK